MSETPRTYACLTELGLNFGSRDPFIEFARKLERELAAMTVERDGWKTACEAAQKVARDNEADLAAALAEVERLRDALGVIARNVDAGAVHISWCADYAKRILGNTELVRREPAQPASEPAEPSDTPPPGFVAVEGKQLVGDCKCDCCCVPVRSRECKAFNCQGDYRPDRKSMILKRAVASGEWRP